METRKKICGQQLKMKSNLKDMEDKEKQLVIDLVKSMHKCVMKAIHYDKKQKNINPVQDVLDGNYKKYADNAASPARRTGVMYKTEDLAKKLAEAIVSKYLENKKK